MRIMINRDHGEALVLEGAHDDGVRLVELDLPSIDSLIDVYRRRADEAAEVAAFRNARAAELAHRAEASRTPLIASHIPAEALAALRPTWGMRLLYLLELLTYSVVAFVLLTYPGHPLWAGIAGGAVCVVGVVRGAFGRGGGHW